MSEKIIPPEQELKKRKRERFIIILSVFLILILTFAELKISHQSSQSPLSGNIMTFVVINVIIILIVLLVFLVFRNVVKIFMEQKSHVIGAKLKTKLVLAFVSLSLIPTLLLFLASAGYISNSIQNWFNKEVETSLTESMDVAQAYYKSNAENALYYGEQISRAIQERKLINNENLPALKVFIREKQNEYNLGVVEVYSSQKEELVRAKNPKLPSGDFTSPDSEDILEGLKGKNLTKINSVGKADLIRGIVPIRSNWNRAEVVGVVVVNYYVPYSLVSKMKEITSSYHQFRQLKILKNPITTGYILALFLITLTIIFLSIWFGVYLARSLTTPLQQLADAAAKVAGGDFDVHLGDSGTEEISTLIDSFNRMTAEVETSRKSLQLKNEELLSRNIELDQRRLYIETLLKNMTSGVISTDKSGVIRTVNLSATRLLNLDAQAILGRNFRDILNSVQLEAVLRMLQDMQQKNRDNDTRQIAVKSGDTRLILQARVSLLREDSGQFAGIVTVFDDITNIIKAQRMAAWREVARRIAHEIKNPLTPIQLSAQRLRKRYLDRFSGDDGVFDQCTSTIITSVDELKTLVDEFSRFARMPASQPALNDLNEIVREAISLYSGTFKHIRFIDRLGEIAPLNLDRDQIKRVCINLFDNAISASGDSGEIVVSSGFTKDKKSVFFSVADSGSGIPDEDKPKLFEPYFSTKKSGTGLGLAIVSDIVSDHKGVIRCRNNIPKGTEFLIEFPLG